MIELATRVLGRFEELMTSLVEGSFSRLLQTPLQPVELAKRLAVALDNAPRQGPHDSIAPNAFTLRLNPRDHTGFEAILPSLEAELARYALQAAEERDLVLFGPAIVRVVADPAVPMRGVRADAECLALGGAPGAPGARVEVTQAVAPPGLRTPPPVPEAAEPRPGAAGRDAGGQRAGAQPAWLSAAPGSSGPERFALDGVSVRIGRATDNDLVLSDERLSRHHAELRRAGGRWTLVDLGSRNGTYVNGRRAGEIALADGDRIRVGSVELIFSG
jgi:hypothetical protein